MEPRLFLFESVEIIAKSSTTHATDEARAKVKKLKAITNYITLPNTEGHEFGLIAGMNSNSWGRGRKTDPYHDKGQHQFSASIIT